MHVCRSEWNSGDDSEVDKRGHDRGTQEFPWIITTGFLETILRHCSPGNLKIILNYHTYSQIFYNV